MTRRGTAHRRAPACKICAGHWSILGERTQEETSRREETLRRELAPGELLLEAVGVNTLRAWFQTGEGLVRLRPDVHVGMVQDSVLLWDRAERSVDFRYFPKVDRMEPYHLSDGLKTIQIRNLGNGEVVFGYHDRKVTCPPGKTTAIPTSDYNREGLFSPNAVNGKGLYRGLAKEGPGSSDQKE